MKAHTKKELVHPYVKGNLSSIKSIQAVQDAAKAPAAHTRQSHPQVSAMGRIGLIVDMQQYQDGARDASKHDRRDKSNSFKGNK